LPSSPNTLLMAACRRRSGTKNVRDILNATGNLHSRGHLEYCQPRTRLTGGTGTFVLIVPSMYPNRFAWQNVVSYYPVCYQVTVGTSRRRWAELVSWLKCRGAWHSVECMALRLWHVERAQAEAREACCATTRNPFSAVEYLA
jgi:hypothetical protein